MTPFGGAYPSETRARQHVRATACARDSMRDAPLVWGKGVGQRVQKRSGPQGPVVHTELHGKREEHTKRSREHTTSG